MASWFGGNLTSSLDTIRSQVSSSLKEVFDEEEPTDPQALYAVTKDKCEQLQKALDEQKQETEKCQQRVQELLEQKVQAVELQKEVQCQQFRELLKEKEQEISELSEGLPELSEEHKHNQQASPTPAGQESLRKIQELEVQLREERTAHQNEVFALQEAFSERGTAADAGSWHVFHFESVLDLQKGYNAAVGSDEKLAVFMATLDRLDTKETELQDLQKLKSQMSNIQRKQKETLSKLDMTNEALEVKNTEVGRLNELLQEKVAAVKAFEEESKERRNADQVNTDTEETLRSMLADKVAENLQLQHASVEATAKSSELGEEVKLLQNLCDALKDEKGLLKRENEDNIRILAEMKENFNTLRNNLDSLEGSLENQIAKNEILEKSLGEARVLNSSLNDELEKMGIKSKEHEAVLSELKETVSALNDSQSNLEQFKRLLEERDSEMSSLKESMKEKSGNVAKITTETEVYKAQYDALLEEYNQYLSDLDALKEKADSLENCKQHFGSQVHVLEAELEETNSALLLKSEKLNEANAADDEKRAALEALQDKVHSLEKQLFEERSTKRALEDDLEDRNVLIEDLKATANKHQNSEDRVDDDADKDDKIASLESELDALCLQLQAARGEDHSKLVEANTKFEEQRVYLKALEEELEQYKKSVTLSNVEIQDHSEQLNSLQEDFDRCIDDMRNERQQSEERAEDLEKVKGELQEAQRELDATNTQLSAARKHLEEQDEANEMTRSQLDQLRAQLVSVEESNALLEANCNQLKVELTGEREGKQQAIEQAAAHLGEVESSKEEHAKEMNTLILLNATLSEDLENALEGQEQEYANVSRAEKQIQALEEELSEQRDQLSFYKRTLDSFDKRLERERVDKEEKIRDIEAASQSIIDELKLKLEVAEGNLQGKTAEVAMLKGVLEENNATKDISSQNEDRDAELNQLNCALSMKSKEVIELKMEIGRLNESLAHSKEGISRSKAERDAMTKETVNKLSQLIRDKDLEIDALKGRNESLVELLQRQGDPETQEPTSSSNDEVHKLKDSLNQVAKEKQEIFDALTQKHQESISYYGEIERLRAIIQELKQQQNHQTPNNMPDNTTEKAAVVVQDKVVIDNSNEIVVLKAKIKELERRLNLEKFHKATSSPRRRYHSENVNDSDKTLFLRSDSTSSNLSRSELDAETKIRDLTAIVQERDSILKEKDSELLDTHKQIQGQKEQLSQCQEECRAHKRKAESLELHQADHLRRIDELKFECETVGVENRGLSEENSGLNSANARLKVSLEEKEIDLEMAKRNLQQLTQMLEEKSQNSETVQQERLSNITAIQDLQSSIKQLSREKDEVGLRAAEGERELAELRKEVTSVIEKKRRSETELERLRAHLLAVEEGYTSEALAAEERERELRKRLTSVEEALRVSSAAQSSASQEANLKTQSLQREVDTLTEQRDMLLEKLTRLTGEYQSQTMSLDNLTMVLEGFQREKDNLLKLAEKDYRERLARERTKQNALSEEIRSLQDKVDAANEGLSAASRLGEQLEKKGQIIATLKQDIKLREELLKKAQSEIESVANSNAGKVDKYLVKNLVVGYACADENKKLEVLRIVGTVLDFNQEERQKTGLEGVSSMSWMRGWLGSGTRGRSTSEVQQATGLDQSLAKAFIQFLETESTPKVPVKLPVSEMLSQSGAGASRRSSMSNSPSPNDSSSQSSVAPPGAGGRHSPNPLLSSAPAQTLPTFSVNRSSSAILKSVLHENKPPN